MKNCSVDKKLNILVENIIYESDKAKNKVLKKLKAYKLFNDLERKASSQLNSYLKESSKRYILSKSGARIDEFLNSSNNKEFNEISRNILDNDFYNYNFENDKKLSKINDNKLNIRKIKNSAKLIKEIADTIYKNNKKINYKISKKTRKDNRTVSMRDKIDLLKSKLQANKSLGNISNINKKTYKYNLRDIELLKASHSNRSYSSEANKIIKIILDESGKIQKNINDYSQKITEDAIDLNFSNSLKVLDEVGSKLRKEKLLLPKIALLNFEKLKTNNTNMDDTLTSSRRNKREEININKLVSFSKVNRMSLKKPKIFNIKQSFRNKNIINNLYKNNQCNKYHNILNMPFITEPNIQKVTLKNNFNYKNTNELVAESAKKSILLRDVLESKKKLLNERLATLPDIENYEHIINIRAYQLSKQRKKSNTDLSDKIKKKLVLPGENNINARIEKGYKKIDDFEKHLDDNFNKYKQINYNKMMAELREKMDELKDKIEKEQSEKFKKIKKLKQS